MSFKELRQVSDEYERQTRDLPVQSKSVDDVESPRKQSVASTQTDTSLRCLVRDVVMLNIIIASDLLLMLSAICAA